MDPRRALTFQYAHVAIQPYEETRLFWGAPYTFQKNTPRSRLLSDIHWASGWSGYIRMISGPTTVTFLDSYEFFMPLLWIKMDMVNKNETTSPVRHRVSLFPNASTFSSLDRLVERNIIGKTLQHWMKTMCQFCCKSSKWPARGVRILMDFVVCLYSLRSGFRPNMKNICVRARVWKHPIFVAVLANCCQNWAPQGLHIWWVLLWNCQLFFGKSAWHMSYLKHILLPSGFVFGFDHNFPIRLSSLWHPLVIKHGPGKCPIFFRKTSRHKAFKESHRGCPIITLDDWRAILIYPNVGWTQPLAEPPNVWRRAHPPWSIQSAHELAPPNCWNRAICGSGVNITKWEYMYTAYNIIVILK